MNGYAPHYNRGLAFLMSKTRITRITRKARKARKTNGNLQLIWNRHFGGSIFVSNNETQMDNRKMFLPSEKYDLSS